MNIYLSGPVTGRDRNQVTKIFNDAEAKIRSICPTVDIFNPINHISDEQADDSTYALQTCLTALSSPDKPIDVVVQLTNWKHTRGGMLEASIATALNIPCVTINSERLSKMLIELQNDAYRANYAVQTDISLRISGTVNIIAASPEDACYIAEQQYRDPDTLIESLENKKVNVYDIRYSA